MYCVVPIDANNALENVDSSVGSCFQESKEPENTKSEKRYNKEKVEPSPSAEVSFDEELEKQSSRPQNSAKESRPDRAEIQKLSSEDARRALQTRSGNDYGLASSIEEVKSIVTIKRGKAFTYMMRILKERLSGDKKAMSTLKESVGELLDSFNKQDRVDDGSGMSLSLEWDEQEARRLSKKIIKSRKTPVHHYWSFLVKEKSGSNDKLQLSYAYFCLTGEFQKQAKTAWVKDEMNRQLAKLLLASNGSRQGMITDGWGGTRQGTRRAM